MSVTLFQSTLKTKTQYFKLKKTAFSPSYIAAAPATASRFFYVTLFPSKLKKITIFKKEQARSTSSIAAGKANSIMPCLSPFANRTRDTPTR
jgi:hypothetical protein